MPLDSEVPTPPPTSATLPFRIENILVRSNLQAAAFRANPRSGVHSSATSGCCRRSECPDLCTNHGSTPASTSITRDQLDKCREGSCTPLGWRGIGRRVWKRGTSCGGCGWRTSPSGSTGDTATTLSAGPRRPGHGQPRNTRTRGPERRSWAGSTRRRAGRTRRSLSSAVKS
jgi:hypothetical protein